MPTGNPGGNSRQRKKAKKSEERIVDEVAKRLSLYRETDTSPPAASSKEQQPMGQEISIRQKSSAFWGSTPVWGGIGVLIGAIASQLSLKLLFVAVWAVFIAEFIRVGFFKQRRGKIFGNIVVGLVLALLFSALWELSPRPHETPTLDQQMDAFSRKFPLLGKAQPAPQITVSVPPSQSPKSLAYPRMVGNTELLNGVVLQPNTPQFSQFSNTAGFHQSSVYIANPGPGPAKDLLYGAWPCIVAGSNTEGTEELGFAKFKEFWLGHQKEKHPEFWAPGETTASNAFINLTDGNISAVQSNASQYYVFAAIQWTDDAGRHQYEFCANFRPGATYITDCRTHSFIEKSVPKLAADKRLY